MADSEEGIRSQVEIDDCQLSNLRTVREQEEDYSHLKKNQGTVLSLFKAYNLRRLF